MAELAQCAAQSSVPALQIDLFGGLTIHIGGERIADLATRKAEALLVYLACRPQPHQREALADLFWDDLPAERAAGNLRLILNQLRQRLAPYLDVTRQTIGLRGDAPCLVDVHTFAQALADDPQDLETIAGALKLYRGDFLQGFHLRDARGFAEWQAAQADHWRRQALAWMQRLVDRYIAYSRYAEARMWAARILDLDPLDEAAHRQVMLIHARSGQRHAAIRQYQACRQVLQEELGLDPEPATEALYQRIRSMPAQRPHALPPCASALVGRATELAQVYEWLAASPSRLMSIVGPGGTGKTQLALAAGWRVAREFLGPCDDGVFYLALVAGDAAALADDAQILAEIAKTLGIALSGARALLDQVIEQLRDKEILLIVDNGELMGPSARLALGALAQHAPALRILVPSRERLKLREEQALDLAGLAYPSLPARAVSAQMEQQLCDGIPAHASVQLFLACADRIAGVRAFEEYERHNQLAIGRICQIVQGLPLAIELATPWLRVRSPAEILRELAQTIDLLAADMPDLPERHRSIRAVFEYSWRLLAEREQRALANLAVFPDSFSAEAAEAIADVALPLLAALRDKSLLQSIKAEAETRYALHPLLRRLALEKLQIDSAIEADLRARHARHFAAFAAQREGLLHGPQGAETLQALEREIENLRAGWGWAIATGDIETLGRYSIPLHDFCAIRGWEIEGRRLFHAAGAAIREWTAREAYTEASVTAAARALSCWGGLEYTLGDLDAAEGIFQQCRGLLTLIAAEDTPELLYIYKQLGLIAYQRGAYDKALEYLHFTLQIADECADAIKIGDTLLSISAVALAQGDWRRAEQALQRGMAVYHTLGSEWGVGHMLRFAGMLALARDERAAARQQLQRSLAMMRKLGHRMGEALALDQLGMLYLAEHQLDQSAATLQQGLAIFQELGLDPGITRALCHLGRLALAGQAYDEARRHCLHALEVAERTRMPPLQIESAAGALHLLTVTDVDTAAALDAWAALDLLLRHPACSADTRRYIASFLPQQQAERANGAGSADRPWSLERLQQTIAQALREKTILKR